MKSTSSPTSQDDQEKPVVILDIDDCFALNQQFNTRQVLAAINGDVTVNGDAVWQKVFHEPAKQNLRLLHDEFEPWYVISSSWTLHLTKEQLCEAFTRTGLGFVAESLHMQWCTPRVNRACRFTEINAWLDAFNTSEPLPFVILDDPISGQSLIGSRLEDRTVLCEARVGFTLPKLRTAQRILREQLKAPQTKKDTA